MKPEKKPIISVSTNINAPVEKVWDCWTSHDEIIKWHGLFDDWYLADGNIDLRVGGRFNYKVETKDAGASYNVSGIYNTIKTNKLIEYTYDDGRKVKIVFNTSGDLTELVHTFEADDTHPVDLQHDELQIVLDKFKKYTESK